MTVCCLNTIKCISKLVQLSLGKASTATTELAQEKGEVQITYTEGAVSSNCKFNFPSLFMLSLLSAIVLG